MITKYTLPVRVFILSRCTTREIPYPDIMKVELIVILGFKQAIGHDKKTISLNHGYI